MEKVNEIVGLIDTFVWGPRHAGTSGWYWNLPDHPSEIPSMEESGVCAPQRSEQRGKNHKTRHRDVSPFSALMTALAATIGTGNIIGVATAMFAGGPGALVWMWISACFGLTSKFSECMLAIKYRETNEKGEMSGGPMYTMKNAFKNKHLAIPWASICIIYRSGFLRHRKYDPGQLHIWFSDRNLRRALLDYRHRINRACLNHHSGRHHQHIQGIFRSCPCHGYLLCHLAGLIVICGNITNVPHGLYLIFGMAFHPQAIGGGVLGTITVSVMNSLRYGVARGVFSMKPAWVPLPSHCCRHNG